MNPTLRAVLNSMKAEPENWAVTHFTFINMRTNTEVWTANGFWFYGLYRPKEVKWSFIEKILFHRAMNRWHRAVDYSGLTPTAIGEQK